ncbi:MAG: zinc-dependent metalloprotease, partial [Burkholderiales bacterium]|nr:zinc-dependent metalloprotease [Burkholderiales bacterium]
WYHNVMSLVHNWYFVQCSPVDPLARSMTFPSELMGQLVRFVSSHEVGHTLGLRHNFGATSYYTTEQLRDPEFLRANGHTASIMDYSRFNFVVQPEDNVSRELLFPRLSHYDNWAIEWGYRRLYQFADVQEEIPYLNQWVIEKTKDPYLRFNGGSESGLNDPRAQSEDLGDNQMETCELGIRNLKVIMQNLPEWTKVPNENYRGLSTLYPQITSQFSRYIGHVSKWVAGVYVDAKTVEQEGPIYVNVSKNKQKEAMAFLERHIFTTPLWLLPDYLSELLPSSRLSIMENLQNSAITGLVNENVLVRMLRAEEQLGPAAYSAEEFFKDMNRYVFGDYGQTDIYCRSLQNIYVNTLCKMITPEKPSDSATTVAMMRRMSVSIENNDVKALVAAELETIAKKLKRGRGDDRTRAHYNYLIKTIENL